MSHHEAFTLSENDNTLNQAALEWLTEAKADVDRYYLYPAATSELGPGRWIGGRLASAPSLRPAGASQPLIRMEAGKRPDVAVHSPGRRGRSQGSGSGPA